MHPFVIGTPTATAIGEIAGIGALAFSLTRRTVHLDIIHLHITTAGVIGEMKRDAAAQRGRCRIVLSVQVATVLLFTRKLTDSLPLVPRARTTKLLVPPPLVLLLELEELEELEELLLEELLELEDELDELELDEELDELDDDELELEELLELVDEPPPL
jgi:hypothetical protein